MTDQNCSHGIIFRESLPKNQKWYCRTCFIEVINLEKYK